MGASNWPGLAIPKPTSPARAAASLDRRKAKADRLVYAYVNERDGLRCRACGTYAGVDAHRHHLLGRKITSRETVCNICDECHDKMHVRLGGKKLKVYGDADQRDRFGRLNGLTVERRLADGRWVTELGL
jgi:hypothetical protein